MLQSLSLQSTGDFYGKQSCFYFKKVSRKKFSKNILFSFATFGLPFKACRTRTIVVAMQSLSWLYWRQGAQLWVPYEVSCSLKHYDYHEGRMLHTATDVRYKQVSRIWHRHHVRAKHRSHTGITAIVNTATSVVYSTRYTHKLLKHKE
jgi:hypothetical protein